MFNEAMSKPVVTPHPETGAVITPSTNNPEWGTVRLDSVQTSFNNGIINKSRRSAFVRGEIKVLETLGLVAGMEVDGKIIKRESHTPFYENQSPKINPSTQEVIMKDGKPVYLEFAYTPNTQAQDEWVVAEETTVATV